MDRLGSRWPLLAGVCAGAVLIGAFAAPAALRAAGDLDQATERLRAGLEEWRREDAAYRAARAAGKVSPAESEDYAAFVAGLRLRVLQQCEVVRGLGGEEAVKPFDCVRSGNSATRGAVVAPPAAVLTDEEKRAALEARLNATEGEIDEALLKRQQAMRQEGTGRGGGGGAGGRGSAAGATGGSEASGDAEGREAAAGASASSQGAAGEGGAGQAAGRTGRPGAPGPTSQSGAPRETARDDGSGDDVVARQLREAAEKETDPVLKEKLWEEYRKYREAKR